MSDVYQLIFRQQEVVDTDQRIKLLEQELSSAREQISLLNSELLQANEGWSGHWELNLRENLTTWDLGFYRMLGVEESTQPDMRIFRDKLESVCIDKLNGAINKTLVNKSDYSFEHYLKDGKGGHLIARTDLKPILNEAGDIIRLVGKLTDITNIKNASREIEKLSLIAAHTSNAVATLDGSGNVDWINSAFTVMTGYRPEEIKSRPIRILIPESNKSVYTPEWLREKFTRDNEYTHEEVIVTKRGKKLWVVVNISPVLDYSLNPVGYIVIVTDITELKQTQQELSNKNREVTDSINYARRIQEAILPSERLMSDALKDSFVLYLPKDIIAGDFYWLERVAGWVLFAAADCTGHGVPGAMVSVLCHGAVHRSVSEFGLVDPGAILNKTRELVLETFEKSDLVVHDGMDISFCAWNETTKELLFAGANNGLFHVRQGALTDYKGSKQPIGRFANATEFVSSRVEIVSGDMIFIYTDGYGDQFGGPTKRSKKFMKQRVMELFAKVSSLNVRQQREELLKAHLDWKGTEAQVDDICIIGFRIP